MNYAVFHDYFIDKSSPEIQGAAQSALERAECLYAEGHDNRDAQQRHAVLIHWHGPAGGAVCDLQSGDRKVAIFRSAARRHVHLQLRLHRKPHHGQWCRVLHGRRSEWKGEKPAGIVKVFRSETDFSIAGFRTQLFDAGDIENVRKIQTGYRGQTLSQFQHKPAPPSAPAIEWPKIDKELADSNPFGLHELRPAVLSPGQDLRQWRFRCARASRRSESGPVKPFAADKLTPEQKSALEMGMRSGLEKIKQKSGI